MNRICKDCGERLVVETKENASQDSIYRYLCSFCQYVGEWNKG